MMMPNTARAPVFKRSFLGQGGARVAAFVLLAACCFVHSSCASTGGGAGAMRPHLPLQPEAEDAPLGLHGYLRGDGRSVLLVFDMEVDPTTVRPEVFAAMRADGEVTRLERASLGPGNEIDEHRSVWLEWSRGSTASPAPVAVQVVGPLFAEDGRSLQGLRTKLVASDRPDEIVHAEVAQGDCHEGGASTAEGGSSWRVRTYWSDAMWLPAKDLGALRSTEIEFADGQRSRLRAVADVESRGSSDTTDNVVDLCFTAVGGLTEPPADVLQLWVPMEALVDAQGQGNAGQRIKLRTVAKGRAI